MTEKQVTKYIIEKRRTPLSFDDYTNFLVLILPPMFLWLGIAAISAYYKFDSSIWILIIGVALIPFSLLFLYISIVRVFQNFTFSVFINTNELDIAQLEALISTAFKTEFIKVDKKNNRLTAKTGMTAFSWGEIITIILTNTEVLVNSRPGSGRQPFTITKDVKNVKKIKKLVEG